MFENYNEILGKLECPVCQSTNFETILKVNSKVEPYRKFSIVRCLKCTHGILFPKPTIEELNLFYNLDYVPYNANKILKPHKSIRCFVLNKIYGKPCFGRIFYKLFQWLIPNYPDYVLNGKVLDVGCGSGTILMELQDLGWNCDGLDIGDAVKNNLAKVGIHVLVGNVLDTLKSIKSNTYNALLSSHSLEHFSDIIYVINEINRVLCDGGQLLITVPNIESSVAKRQQQNWYAISCPAHLHFFSKQSLIVLLENAGFKVENWGYTQVERSYVEGYPKAGFLRKSPLLFKILVVIATKLKNFFNDGDIIVVRARKINTLIN